MVTWIVLFRGVNVGGHNKLPMRDLSRVLAGIGARRIETYIQSGNVVFDHKVTQSKELTKLIVTIVEENFGFVPHVHLLSVADLLRAVEVNPYPDAVTEPKTLHLFFLGEEPGVLDSERMDEVKADTEHYALVGKVFYLHAPAGIGRSKLASRAEALLGVSATARNWRTVTKVLQLAVDLRGGV